MIIEHGLQIDNYELKRPTTLLVQDSITLMSLQLIINYLNTLITPIFHHSSASFFSIHTLNHCRILALPLTRPEFSLQKLPIIKFVRHFLKFNSDRTSFVGLCQVKLSHYDFTFKNSPITNHKFSPSPILSFNH